MKFDTTTSAKLEIMTKPSIIDEIKHKDKTGYCHICIKVNSKEKLEAIIEFVHSDGYEVLY